MEWIGSGSGLIVTVAKNGEHILTIGDDSLSLERFKDSWSRVAVIKKLFLETVIS